MTSLVARPHVKPLRLSVVVPCCRKHVQRLEELFKHLGQQTRKPDEIIVAISGCDPPRTWPRGVRLVPSAEPKTCGQNRNLASEAATGDVLVYQDADDLPHPQRVEIVGGLFERYEIEHLMHGYVYTRGATWSIGFPSGPGDRFPVPVELPSLSTKGAAERSSYRSQPLHTTRVTNGEVAVLRSVWAAVRWPERAGTGTDQEFNRKIFGKFKRTVTTELPLVIYRHDFSSFR